MSRAGKAIAPVTSSNQIDFEYVTLNTIYSRVPPTITRYMVVSVVDIAKNIQIIEIAVNRLLKLISRARHYCYHQFEQSPLAEACIACPALLLPPTRTKPLAEAYIARPALLLPPIRTKPLSAYTLYSRACDCSACFNNALRQRLVLFPTNHRDTH